MSSESSRVMQLETSRQRTFKCGYWNVTITHVFDKRIWCSTIRSYAVLRPRALPFAGLAGSEPLSHVGRRITAQAERDQTAACDEGPRRSGDCGGVILHMRLFDRAHSVGVVLETKEKREKALREVNSVRCGSLRACLKKMRVFAACSGMALRVTGAHR
eukprot:892260-Rhodomonas_salina.1